ncbi:HepT-like ribonuclease domain-containing protein [uncultured Duncaniella sp.]
MGQIERMRHVLVHGYYTVGYDFIKEVIETDIPLLKEQISRYLREMD